MPIAVTSLDKTIFVADAQLANAESLMLVTAVGILKTPSVSLLRRLRLVQPEKAEEPIEVTDVGTVIFSTLARLANAEAGIVLSRVIMMLFNVEGAVPKIVENVAVESTLLPINGTVIFATDEQPLNVLDAILVTVSGTMISVINLKF